MPIINTTQTITITPGIGVVSLPTTSPLDLYIITGTATLTSNATIQPTGTPVLGTEYRFRYEANVNLNGNDITIFGVLLPTNLSDKTHEISSYFNGVSWEVNFTSDISENNSIPYSNLPNSNFLPMNAIGFLLGNDKESPLLENSVQGDCTTDSDLYVRAKGDENTLDIIGEVLLQADETAVVGDLNAIIFSITNVGDRVKDFKIPVVFSRHDLTGIAVMPTSYVNGYIYFDDSFSPCNVNIDSADLGTSTNVAFRTYINFKLPY